MLGGTNGVSGVIPALPVVNTDYTYQNSTTIPSNWNMYEIEVIAYVFEKELGKTNSLNAVLVNLLSTGIHNASKEFNSVHIYPNPVSDYLILQNGQAGVENYVLKIYDIVGKIVLAKSLTSIQNQKVNVSALKTGIYFMHLTNSDNETHQFKMIKK